MSESFDHVYAITIQGRTQEMLVGIRGDEMFWDCGASCCAWTPNYVSITKDYTEEHLAGASVDAIRSAFGQEFRPGPRPQKPSARLGWIDPEGIFFPCSYCAHRDLAEQIARTLLSESRPLYGVSGERALEERGWMRLMGGGRVVMGSRVGHFDQAPHPTAAQIETLGKVVEAFTIAKAEGVDFNESLKDNPEGYMEQLWETSPNERGDLVSNLRARYQTYAGEAAEAAEEPLTKRLAQHPGD